MKVRSANAQSVPRLRAWHVGTALQMLVIVILIEGEQMALGLED